MLKKIILLSFVLFACTKKEVPVEAPQMSEMEIKNYKGPNILDIVPAKSLGDVHIGDKMMALMKIGFAHDEKYSDPGNHMLRGDIILFLVDDQVVQIGYKTKGDYGRLKLKEKDFPNSKAAMYMRAFFKNCEPDEKVKTGFVIYCENRGIRIDYDGHGTFSGFSVITPANQAQVPVPTKLK